MPSCYPNQLAAKLADVKPAVVLLWGDDAGALRQAADTVVAASGIDPADPFASERLTLPELAASPSRLADSALTPSFLGGKRLIRIAGISGEEGGMGLKSQLDTLLGSLTLILARPLDSVLVLVPIPRHLDAKHPLVVALEKHSAALTVRFFADTEKDTSTWLSGRLNAAGKAIDRDALSFLAAGLGADREIAAREVEKLLLYTQNTTGPISKEDVRASLSGAPKVDEFRLADAVANRDTALADRLLQAMLSEGEDLQPAFNAAVRLLGQIKGAQAAQKAGQSQDAILQSVGKFKAPPAAREAFMGHVRSYPAGRLKNLSGYAFEALLQARSGPLPAGQVLSRALLALAS